MRVDFGLVEKFRDNGTAMDEVPISIYNEGIDIIFQLGTLKIKLSNMFSDPISPLKQLALFRNRIDEFINGFREQL